MTSSQYDPRPGMDDTIGGDAREKTRAPSANDRQVGGTHYRRGGEQHWDRIWRLYGPGYFVGCITKYVERYQDKNGIQDLEKAQHFLQKLIELEGMKPKTALTPPWEGVHEDVREHRFNVARANQE